MNRNKLVYIHIPKTGGTFILNTIFYKDNLEAAHKKINKYDFKNKITFTTIRSPIDFYYSFYNFFKKPNHTIRNKFKDYIKKYDDINSFTYDFLNNKSKFQKNSGSDIKYYTQSNNKYGCLTNFYLYYFNYEGGNIKLFLENLKNKVVFLKQENLKQDVIDFCSKHQIKYDKKKINKKINENKKISELNQSIKNLILNKDKLIIDIFYT